jgi:hypothetical protein
MDLRLGRIRGTLAGSCRSSPINTDNGASLKHSCSAYNFVAGWRPSRTSNPLNTFEKFGKTSLERFRLGLPHKTKGLCI